MYLVYLYMKMMKSTTGVETVGRHLPALLD